VWLVLREVGRGVFACVRGGRGVGAVA
jgi:hypothetical protein